MWARLTETMVLRNHQLLTYRNSFEITRDVLHACFHGATLNRIVYAANLNDRRAKNYLKLCLDLKLVAVDESEKFRSYKLTEKGAKTIQTILNSNDKIKSFMTTVLKA